MVQIVVVDREGETVSVDAEEGTTLMEAIRDLDNSVEAICGGMCSCATCHCLIDPDWFGRLAERSDDELDLLQELDSYDADRSRLACQVELAADLDGLKLVVGPEE